MADVAWAARMGAYSVTSPNIRTIPFMPTGRVALRMRRDGRFGEHDFTICPQVFSSTHAHRALVRNRDSPENSHLECMWWTPTSDDFENFENSAYSDLGRCSNATVIQIDKLALLLNERVSQLSCGPYSAECNGLAALCGSMRRTILGLRFHPYTEREMIIGIAHAQRLYLETLALADYIEFRFALRMDNAAASLSAPLLHLLGALTEDLQTLNCLQIAGLPAYLVVDNEHATVLGATYVRNTLWQSKHVIIREDWHEAQHLRPMPILYEGEASEELHNVITQPPRYDSLEKYFFYLDGNYNVIPVGKRGTIGVVNRIHVRSKRKVKSSIITGTT